MKLPSIAGMWVRNMLPLFILGVVILSAGTFTNATTLPVSAKVSIPLSAQAPRPCPAGHQVGFLSTYHGELVDATTGCQVILTGVNWFGFETSTLAPQGLWARNWKSMLQQMAHLGFNTIRLPFTDQLFEPGSKPQSINYQLNPDLKGLQGLALMDKIIQGARSFGLKVILDRHDPTADQRPGLWYTDHLSQSQWIQDWVMLAKHYRGNSTVIGADLANEPHSPATWGTGDPNTDWRLAAQKAGNAILAANPNWLIIVEGVDTYQNASYWWGGNLEGVRKFPVRLSEPSKLVYSAHDYGPSVYNQPWFQAPKPADLAHTLPAIWQKYWAYVQEDGIAPVLVGEFGGPSMGQDTEGVWQRTLVSFLKAHHISYTYWAWNPNSGDTGGILNNDWTTVNQSKLNVLKTYQWPLLDHPATRTGNSCGSDTAIQNAYQGFPA